MKKNIKPLVISALMALAFTGVGVAGTFALFTDKAETTVEVTSGKVKLGRTFEVKSVHELNHEESISGVNGVYTNSIGGTVTVNEEAGTVTLNKWAPGDKLVMDITNVNHSNVKILTRFKATHSSTSSKDLYEALKVSYEVTSDIDVFRWRAANIPANPATGETLNKIRLTVEFPNHDNDITANSQGINNAYQDMNCTLVFTQEAVQGNADVKSLPDVLNLALNTSSEVNPTLSKALDEVKLLATEAEVKAEKLVWNSANDTFCYEGEVPATADKINYFAMYDSVPTAHDYSIYAAASGTGGNTVTGLGVGFDAGSTSIDDITVETSTNKHLIYKTNGGTLTIDAPNATFSHYGTANVIEIDSVADHSYHEFGKATFVKIKKGRVVVEEKAEIGGIHIKQVEDAYQDIKIGVAEGAELPALSRDAVSLEENEKKLVVEVQQIEETAVTKQEYVWIENVTTSTTDGIVITSDKAGTEVVSEEAQQTEEAKEAKTHLKETKQEAEAIADACAVVAPELPKEEQGVINYVAQIGALSGTKYETFEAALAAAVDGDTIVLLDDITSADGKGYLIDKNLYLNTNGHKITVETGSNVSHRAFLVDTGNTFSVYGGGTIDAKGEFESGCYGAFRAEVGSKLVLKNLTLKNYRSYGLNVKILGATAELTNVKITSVYGGGIEVTDDEGADGSVVGSAVLRNCEIAQTGYSGPSTGHCSTAVSVSGASTLDVYSSSFSGEYGAFVYSSGGTINIYGGSWSGSRAALQTTYESKYNNPATINVHGGIVRGEFSLTGYAFEHINIYGGMFDHDPASYLAQGRVSYYDDALKLYCVEEGVWVESESELSTALAGTAPSIHIANDFSAAGIIEVTRNVKIHGHSHTITSSATRILWVDAGNIQLDLMHINLVGGSATERGVQANNGLSKIAINMNDVHVSGISYYAINICSNTTIDMNIYNSSFSGWGALNCWANGQKIHAEKTTFEGKNDKEFNAEGWNNFATIILEGDTTGETDASSRNTNVELVGCTIISRRTNGNYQAHFGFNDPSANNTLSFKECEFEYYDTSSDPLNVDILGYNWGTGNTLVFDGETVPMSTGWFVFDLA